MMVDPIKPHITTRANRHRRTDRTRTRLRCTGEETTDDVATRVRRRDTATAEDATMTVVGITEAADATAADDEAVTEGDDRGSEANATGRCRRGST